jgi:hypothetical protein
MYKGSLTLAMDCLKGRLPTMGEAHRPKIRIPALWLKPVILVPWKVEIRRITVEASSSIKFTRLHLNQWQGMWYMPVILSYMEELVQASQAIK